MKMFYKKGQYFVEVYHFFEDNTALCFSNIKNWERIEIRDLIPEKKLTLEHINIDIRKKFEEKLYKTELGWATSDHLNFIKYDNALFHEIINSL